MPFGSAMFGSLDLAQAASQQYGADATIVSDSEHLYDWRARVKVQTNPDVYADMPLDIAQAARSEYGATYVAVALGVHRYDWRALRFSDLNCVVLPVMEVACDRFYDITGVRNALDRFRSVLENVQTWYEYRAGTTFPLVQPLVTATRSPSARWNELSARTDSIPEERYVFLRTALDEYARALPAPGVRLRVAIGVYTGDSPDVWLGAASSGRTAVAPPRATSVTCPISGPLDFRCADASYALGHELGHTFGLCHSCDTSCWADPSPDCHQSIMETAKPPDAILLPDEITILKQTCFFSRRRRPGKKLPRRAPGQRRPRPQSRSYACVIDSAGPSAIRKLPAPAGSPGD